jgi:(S)-ureidoglycine aminohydrolase
LSGSKNLTPYAVPVGGLPAQSERLADRAIFTTAYAIIPKTVMTDIVTSYLPFWDATRLWVLARPLSGFSESFSHYLMEVAAGGGSSRPDDDINAQHVLFVVSGTITLGFNSKSVSLSAGGYAYLPAGLAWTAHNTSDDSAFGFDTCFTAAWSWWAGSVYVVGFR